MVEAKGKGEKPAKKLKKVQQNKTAAARPNQKKRAEFLTGQCKELEKKNKGLKEKAGAPAKKIRYLKHLVAEVHRARGKKRLL